MALKIQYKPFRNVRNDTSELGAVPTPLRHRLLRFGALTITIVGLAGVAVFMLLHLNERDLQSDAPWVAAEGETESAQASPSGQPRSAPDQFREFRGFQSRAEEINRFNRRNSPFAPPVGSGAGSFPQPPAGRSPFGRPGQPGPVSPRPGGPSGPGPR